MASTLQMILESSARLSLFKLVTTAVILTFSSKSYLEFY